MQSEFLRRWGPWAILAVVAAPLLYVVIPKLNYIVWEGINLVYGVIVLAIIFASLPLLALIVRNLLWKARKEVIGAMAIETLETGLQAVWSGIQKLEGRIADAGAQLKAFGQLTAEEKDLLGEEGLAENDHQLEEGQRLQTELVEERDNQIANFRVLERNIKRYKLMNKRGLAFKALLGVLTAGTDGQGAQDMSTAMEAIQTQMNEAQARVEMILSRPKARRKPAIPIEVTELPPPPAALQAPRQSVNELPSAARTPEGVVVRRPPFSRS